MNHDAATEYLATSAVARRLGVSRSTVLRAVRRGEIRPALHTPGGALRFRSLDVETYAGRLSGQPPMDSAPTQEVHLSAEAVELNRLYRMLDHLPAAIAYWDADLRNVFANRAHIEWFGMTPDQMRGLHVREVMGDVRYALARPYLEAAMSGVAQSYCNGLSTTYKAASAPCMPSIFPT